VGSDDGWVHVTKDGGVSWQKISDTFPKDLWVSRVVASKHKKERVYVTLNGYRWDDFKPYVYQSDDYGQTWKSIEPSFETNAVNVIVEDTVNSEILYLGTDNGLYVTFQNGKNWQLFMNDLPPVAVHDLVIQTEAKDLIIGTHGRSIYKVNLAAIQQINNEVLATTLKIFPILNITHSDYWGNSWSAWLPPNEASVPIDFYSFSAGEVNIQVLNEKGVVIKETKQKVEAGLNQWEFDLEISKEVQDYFHKKDKKIVFKPTKKGKVYLSPGKYQVKIAKEKTVETSFFEITDNKRN
jgi:hypothetical protein